MATPRTPSSVKQATRLCELYAELDGQIAGIEADRNGSIAAINARADRALNDLIKQRDAIVEKLSPWWDEAAEDLTQGKRKSIELGGCQIGKREGKESLKVKGKPADIVSRLIKTRWGKNLVRISASLDKRAILKIIGGKRAAELQELGLTTEPGVETFFITRIEQEGTRAKV